ncbi:glycosyl transferase [Streptomyces sp. NPDC048392]|uniref:glycosyl transferase n=1 Tax=Streptomyces sp. NPDC048392 TaxID=3365543 RepID=UPI00371FBBA4
MSTAEPAPKAADDRPHLLYFAIGFPPAAKSCVFRMRETANQFASLGWRVTVVTIEDEGWLGDCGIDQTLTASVDPRIDILKLPLSRDDLETDLRQFSRERAIDPQQWHTTMRDQASAVFPDPVFGGWRYHLEEAALRIHRENPVTLSLASCVPYVQLAAVRRLYEECEVPYAVDFRDGWSIDVVDDVEAFPRDSEAGKWEERVIADAVSFWCVNDPIAEHYRNRYPEHRARIHVVRNGYDADSVDLPARQRSGDEPLVFGHLGTISFSVRLLEKVLEAWRAARARDPLVASARLEVRGHIGVGANRGANKHMELLREAADDGVVVDGPVPKAEVAKVYGGWDALVLVILGGRHMTSGKVYEYMSTGLPIVSMHEREHDASHLLDGHPLWTGAHGLDVEKLTESFCRAAHLAASATDGQRRAARAHGEAYERGALMRPAVQALTELVTGAASGAGEKEES